MEGKVIEARTLSPTRTLLGESPVWHGDALFWTDVNGGRLHRFDSAGQESRWNFDTPVVAVAATSNAALLLVVLGDRLVLFDPASGTWETMSHPAIGWPARRFNDFAVDRAGRLFVGTMRNNIAPNGSHVDVSDRAGNVLTISGSGELSTCGIADLSCPNGLGFSPDGKRIYWADSPTNLMMSGRYDVTTANISNPAIFGVPFPRGIPDGSAVDAAGFIWNARFGGGCVVRFAPDGRIDRVIDLPVTYPTCCCFGGPTGDTLFITTASVLASPDEALAGALLALEPRVAGASRHPFVLERTSSEH